MQLKQLVAGFLDALARVDVNAKLVLRQRPKSEGSIFMIEKQNRNRNGHHLRSLQSSQSWGSFRPRGTSVRHPIASAPESA